MIGIRFQGRSIVSGWRSELWLGFGTGSGLGIRVMFRDGSQVLWSSFDTRVKVRVGF